MFIEELDTIDLRVEEGEVPAPDHVLSGGYTFDDSSFVVTTPSGRVQVEEGLIRAGSVSPTELLRWVTYAMRKRLMERRISVLHASAVARDGEAYVFPAWAQTGKTNLQLSLLAHGYDYMSDDWCPVSLSGEVLAFPRYLNLYEYNFHCHPQLVEALGNGKEGRAVRRQLASTRFARSLNGSNWLVGILQRRLLDHFSVYARASVSQLIHGCNTTLRAPLARVCLLNTRMGNSTISEVSPRSLARKVALINHFEQSPFTNSQIAGEYAGLLRMERDPISREEDLLTSVFSRAKCLLVTLPRHATGEEIDRVREMLEEI